MNAPKIYVPGSTAKVVTNDYGPILKLSFRTNDLCKFLAEHGNERGYINLNITQRKAPGLYGDTHSVWLDQWEPDKPDADRNGLVPKSKIADESVPPAKPDNQDDVPF